MSESNEEKKTGKVAWLLVVLPAWLVVSSLIGLWMWSKKQDEIHEPAKFAIAIEQDGLESDLAKVVDWVGPRHTQSEAGRRGLRRMAAMIAGSLGPSNAGYRIEQVSLPAGEDEESWPIIMARRPGGEGEPLWLVAGYDQAPASDGVELNATGVVSLMAVAQSISGEVQHRPVVFCFLPHAYEADAPWQVCAKRLREKAGSPERVLVIESMGAGESLMISSRDQEIMGHPAIEAASADVSDAERVRLIGDHDFASRLFETGLPAVRVASRGIHGPDEEGRAAPDPAKHVASSVALAELVRALAAGEPQE